MRARSNVGRSSLLLAAPVLLTLLAVTLLAVPVAGPQENGYGYREPAEEGPLPDGRGLYLRDCAFCHGEEGAGTPRGQSLRDIGPAEVDYALSTGRMPIEEPGEPRERREPAYERNEIRAMIAYMRPFLAPQPDIPHVDPEAGKLEEGFELFQVHCVSCHQWAGQGGALLGMETPALKESTALEIAEAVRSGPTTMPEYGHELISDEEMNSLVKYVLSLRQPENRGGAGLYYLGPLPEGAVSWIIGMGVIVMALFWIGERK